jgi:hypothetical protein
VGREAPVFAFRQRFERNFGRGVAVVFGQKGVRRMRYFGSKQYVQPDEDAIAAERLTAIASRFKADLPSSLEGFEVMPESDEAPFDVVDETLQSNAAERQQ